MLWLFQLTGKCGSVLVRLIPAPRGTGIVSAPVPKKLLHMAGVDDCYTSATGQTATLGNFGKCIPRMTYHMSFIVVLYEFRARVGNLLFLTSKLLPSFLSIGCIALFTCCCLTCSQGNVLRHLEDLLVLDP